jgi:hypothetical protein
MKLDSNTALMFHDWVRGKHEDPAYLFNELSRHASMVYGTGSAQLYVMAMLGLIDAALRTDSFHVLGMLPKPALEELIDTFRDGGWHKSKTRLEQVSNFWLRDSSSYAMQYTKSITGSTLDTTPRVKTGKKLEKDKKSGAAMVSRIQSEDRTGRFYTEFGNSSFSIEDVINERDTYFDSHGSKARTQTTHGSPMKPSDLIYDAMVRRSCKFLLYDAIKQGQRVVYLLDDLDLSKVAYLSGKSGIPDSARIQSGSSEGKVPICTTELREIFRNWDYFGQHLKFYLNFVECQPPWRGSPQCVKSWALYAGHRAERVLDEKPGALSDYQINCLQRCIGLVETDPGKAISKFHEASPSHFTKGASLHTVVSLSETL